MILPDEQSVLVIDDDADVRDLLSRMLIDAGWKAETAKDGKDGLDKLKTKPSLIVLDLEMPRMDGFEFLEAYMADYKAEERAPVLVYSGKDLTDVQKDLLDKNVAGMVRKDDVSYGRVISNRKKYLSRSYFLTKQTPQFFLIIF